MTSLNDIANSVYLLKMRLERNKDKFNLNIGSEDRDKLQRDTSIFPKPHSRDEQGRKIRMPGTAGGKSPKSTFNPSGSKRTNPVHNQPNAGVTADAGDKLNRRTGRSVGSKLTGPKYYMDPKRTRTIAGSKEREGYKPEDYKPSKPRKEHVSYEISSEKDRKRLRQTPGKDVPRVAGEIKEEKRRRSEAASERLRKPKTHDNRLKPGEKKEIESKHERWRKGKETRQNKLREEASRDYKSPAGRAAIKPHVQPKPEKRQERRSKEEEKQRPKPDKDTKYFAASSQVDSPQIDPKYHGKFKSLERDTRLALMRLERLK